MAHLYQKTPGGCFYIRYRDKDRRQKNRSLSTTSKKEATRLKLEIEKVLDEAGRAEVHIAPRARVVNVPIKEFWDWFKAWAKENRSARTVEEYELWWSQLIDFAQPIRVGDIDVATAERFLTSLLIKGKTGKPLKKSSINNARKTLHAIWAVAQRKGKYLGDNPFSHIEKYEVPRPEEKGYLEKKDIQALLKASVKYAKEPFVKKAEAENVRIAIALMAEAGLRRAEVCWLRWEDVSLEGRTITVTDREEFRTKSRISRRVPINDTLFGILSELDQNEPYILQTTRPTKERFRYRADFRTAFDRVCKIAQLETTPHQLRHSFISRHANAGTPLHKIAGWVGHSTTWITERYGHHQNEFDPAANNI